MRFLTLFLIFRLLGFFLDDFGALCLYFLPIFIDLFLIHTWDALQHQFDLVVAGLGLLTLADFGTIKRTRDAFFFSRIFLPLHVLVVDLGWQFSLIFLVQRLVRNYHLEALWHLSEASMDFSRFKRLKNHITVYHVEAFGSLDVVLTVIRFLYDRFIVLLKVLIVRTDVFINVFLVEIGVSV